MHNHRSKMSSLSTVESRLPPGFRFHPRDEELICDYLMKWVATATGSCSSHQISAPPPLLIQVDLNKCEPWDIPEIACVGGKEWYFYSQRDKKYATGIRTNRATISGYWKATGKDRPILRKETLVGMRKTLVFYEGRAPKGSKTNWVMHEFRLEGPGSSNYKAHHVKEDWVLCKVFYKHASPEVAGSGYEVATPSLSTEPCDLTSHDRTSESGNIIVSHDDDIHHYNQQVPCFSNLTTPNPNFIKMESGAIGHDNIINNNPVMTINCPQSFGEGSSDTVMSGIHHEVGLSYHDHLWNH